MALENPWVNYINRSYKSIKNSIISRMSSLTPEITDKSESNIFIIIIGIFAGLIEQINYYLDSIARESFIVTARRYSSVVKLTRLIDYRIKAKIGATVDLTITAVDGSGNPVLLSNNETLNSGIIVENENGLQFITTKDAVIFANTSSVVVPAKQRVLVTGLNLGTTDSSNNQAFFIHENYQHDTLQITINSISWERVDTFAFSGPQDKHFIVEVNQDKRAFVIFGDDINGQKPTSGHSVLATFYTCSGSDGNVSANTLTEITSSLTPPVQVPVISEYQVTNELNATGGSDEEGLDEIKAKAPLSLRTLDRAVTLQDHVDIALLVPGVNKASVLFNFNSKNIEIYISPIGGGTPSAQLLSDVEDYFSDKKMVSTSIEAKASGDTKLRITMTVTGKFRRNSDDITSDVKEALQNQFGYNNSDVNKQIRRSDIIALIDNLDKVDYLKLNVLTTKPYPRIIYGTSQLENNWYIQVNPVSTEILSWRLVVTNASTLGSDDGVARLYKTDQFGVETFDRSFTINQSDPGSAANLSTDGEISIGMYGTFSVGDEWNFYTYPYNEDHEFQDLTIPVYDEDELSLTVVEQLGV